MPKRVLLILALVFVSCGERKPESIPLDFSRFSLACASTSECMAVDRYACKSSCDAEAVPLRVDDLERYREIRSEHRDECRTSWAIDCVGEEDESWPSRQVGLCVEEQCTLRARLDFAPRTPQSCDADDECVVADASDPCDCDRGVFAVTPITAEGIRQEREAVDCGMGELDCAAEDRIEYAAVCREGECRLEQR